MGLVGVLGGPIRSCRLCISQLGSGKLREKEKSLRIREKRKCEKEKILVQDSKNV